MSNAPCCTCTNCSNWVSAVCCERNACGSHGSLWHNHKRAAEEGGEQGHSEPLLRHHISCNHHLCRIQVLGRICHCHGWLQLRRRHQLVILVFCQAQLLKPPSDRGLLHRRIAARRQHQRCDMLRVAGAHYMLQGCLGARAKVGVRVCHHEQRMLHPCCRSLPLSSAPRREQVLPRNLRHSAQRTCTSDWHLPAACHGVSPVVGAARRPVPGREEEASGDHDCAQSQGGKCHQCRAPHGCEPES
mmetsp:Transcript_86488/g.201257  ORF Transcript_86488/g.201257 Transcript_86488/m.201257 type:complete len:244 (+) Transcript_86488:140-871(+)